MHYWCAAALLLFAHGCSTTNHPPVVAEYYGDLTSHYNAYFNAKEKLKGVFLAVDKTHKDNYKDVIPLFTYADPKETAGFSNDLDEIEKKSTTSVQIHKYSNYVDDHFLLMGKASYLKGDYDKAQAFLKYTTTEFKNGVDYVKERRRNGKTATPNAKKKKAVKPKFKQVLDEKGNLVLQKIDERPQYTLFIHEPARAEALLWLAKTYTAQGKYAEAASVVQYARSDDKFYKDLDPQIELTDADNFLRQRNYTAAIGPLEKYVTMVKGKKKRIRPYFILAQINEIQGNYKNAAEYYKKVLKSNPNYDMEFYAKIKRANLGRKSKSGTDEIKKLLLSMSRDGKYRDYLDQIYYELGEITLSENDRSQARKYFLKSVRSSTKNQDQLAQSFHQLAQMDYEEELYVSSKYYYDSTLVSLAKNDTGYGRIETRDKVLDRLVTQLNIIKTEDSLQRIAKMPKADRDRFLKKLIAEKEKEEARKEQEKNAGKSAASGDAGKSALPTLPGVGGNTDAEQSWYFYNTVLRSSGYNDFVKRWGRRKPEDNWRRKDKSSTASDLSDTDQKKDSTQEEESVDLSTEKLTAGLPMTEAKMQVSEEKTVEAYYAAGTIYKDELRNYRKATSMFEEVNKKFGKHKLHLETLYQLYLLAEFNKNSSKAATYKSTIIAEYPNSAIALYLQDPTYLDQQKKKENTLSDYYTSAYTDYKEGLYASAEEKIKMADVRFNPNALKPKFDLLQVMIYGKQNRLDDYIQALNKLISKLPPSQEKDIATRLLTDLNNSKLPQIDLSKQPKPDTAAAVSPDTAKTFVPAPVAVPVAKDSAVKPAVKTPEIPKNTADTAKPKAPNANPIPVPSAKPDTTSAKPYKPLSKSERLDSILRAEKNNKGKPTTILTSKPATKDSSNKSNTTIADTVKIKSGGSSKPITAKSTADTSKSKSTTVTASKTQLLKDSLYRKHLTDSIFKKHVADSLLKKRAIDSLSRKHLTDSLQKRHVLDSLSKKHIADSLAKKNAIKPIVKDTLKKPITDTVKKVQAPLPSFDTDTATPVYGLSDNAPHLVIIFFRDPNAYNGTLSSKIETGLSSMASAASLSSRSVIVESSFKLIQIKSFANKTEALQYVAALKANADLFSGLSNSQFEIFAISQLNYSTLIASKKINNYAAFYRTNYK
ncbi:MAG: tetratricopeptide repeat protein [Chitinophagales bacterium]